MRAAWMIFGAVLAVASSGCDDGAATEPEGLQPGRDGGMRFPDGGAPDGDLADRFLPPKVDSSLRDALARDAEPMRPQFDAAPRDDAALEDPDAFMLPDSFQDELPTAMLEIYALDIWAQPLVNEASVTVRLDGDAIRLDGFPVGLAGLDEAGDYSITVSAPDHEPAELRVRYDGGDSLDGLEAILQQADNRRGFSVSHELRQVGDAMIPVHTVYVGLRHDWFSASGRPARRGNDLQLLMDGEEAWSAVYDALQLAEEKVLFGTWWWESPFELVRDPERHGVQSERERRPFTIIRALEDTGVLVRVAVGQFYVMDGLLSTLTIDDALAAKGERSGDNFEFMGQANPSQGRFFFEVEPFLFGERVLRALPQTRQRDFDPELDIVSTVPRRDVDLTEWPIDLDIPAASIHQKITVVDDDVAFIGGMNLRRVDWDTSDHLVFDSRRMLFDATAAERLAVADKETLPDAGPRKDYVVRMQGPIAQDVADMFRKRWRHILGLEARYSENATDFEIGRDVAPIRGGVQAQVTVTLPEPIQENSIAETWLNAVAQAEDYIFVEDQYWRAPILTAAIIRRMEQRPNLKLIVVTKPVDESLDPGCFWTHITNEQLLERFPDRYMTLQLRSFDAVERWGFDEVEGFLPAMDVHSKLMIIDDVFASIGSANKNNRGMIYEAELNIAVFDRTWVSAARRRILNNMLPRDIAVAEASDVWWGQLEEAASWNDFVFENWDEEDFDISLDGAALPARYRPRGFLYGLEFRAPVDCLIESIGQDMF